MLFMMILKVDHYDEPQKLSCKIKFTQLNTEAICCIPTVLKFKLNPEVDVFRSQKAKTHAFILNIYTCCLYCLLLDRCGRYATRIPGNSKYRYRK